LPSLFGETKMDDLSLLNLCNNLLAYNKDTGIFYWIKSRGTKKAGSIAGCITHDGYWTIRINRKHYLAHRLAFLMTYGYLPKYIDHINNERSDNRLSNLREASKSENCRNRKKHKGCSSTFKGVCWVESQKSWRATIYDNGKLIYIVQSKSEIEAARAYDQLAIEKFGKFAKTNKSMGLL
jgi:hypothetical protein